MSEKLDLCPFCGGIGSIVFHGEYAVAECKNFECAATTRKIIVKPDAEHEEIESATVKLSEIWNRRVPLYTPVKHEDITDGVYWAVTPDKRKFIVEILRGEAYWGKRQDLSVFLRDCPILYRIPPLNLEVAE